MPDAPRPFLMVDMQSIRAAQGHPARLAVVVALHVLADEAQWGDFACASRLVQHRSGASARQVEAILGALVADGLVEVVDPGDAARRRPRRIRVAKPGAERLAPLGSDLQRRATSDRVRGSGTLGAGADAQLPLGAERLAVAHVEPAEAAFGVPARVTGTGGGRDSGVGTGGAERLARPEAERLAARQTWPQGGDMGQADSGAGTLGGAPTGTRIQNRDPQAQSTGRITDPKAKSGRSPSARQVALGDRGLDAIRAAYSVWRDFHPRAMAAPDEAAERMLGWALQQYIRELRGLLASADPDEAARDAFSHKRGDEVGWAFLHLRDRIRWFHEASDAAWYRGRNPGGRSYTQRLDSLVRRDAFAGIEVQVREWAAAGRPRAADLGQEREQGAAQSTSRDDRAAALALWGRAVDAVQRGVSRQPEGLFDDARADAAMDAVGWSRLLRATDFEAAQLRVEFVNAYVGGVR